MNREKTPFTKKFVLLLASQAGLISSPSVKCKDPYSNWHSVGEVLGSGEYQNHLEHMWVDSESKLSQGKLTDEKEDL